MYREIIVCVKSADADMNIEYDAEEKRCYNETVSYSIYSACNNTLSFLYLSIDFGEFGTKIF